MEQPTAITSTIGSKRYTEGLDRLRLRQRAAAGVIG
jgi:hypothetical protein